MNSIENDSFLYPSKGVGYERESYMDFYSKGKYISLWFTIEYSTWYLLKKSVEVYTFWLEDF